MFIKYYAMVEYTEKAKYGKGAIPKVCDLGYINKHDAERNANGAREVFGASAVLMVVKYRFGKCIGVEEF